MLCTAFIILSAVLYIFNLPADTLAGLTAGRMQRHCTIRLCWLPDRRWIGMQELDYLKIGERVRQVRKAKGWSQEALAKRCGISLNFMGKIERGKRRMSMDTFASLCRELEVDADALLWGVVQPSDAAVQNMWKSPAKKDSDSYAMYIRIMKSVADIMNET